MGKPLSDWGGSEGGREESDKMLAAKQIRVVLYQPLIESAYKSYKEYFDKASAEAGRVLHLIKAIESDESDAS